MITLPMPPRVTWLRAFWLVMSIAAGILAAVVAALAGCPVWLVAGFTVAAAMALPGLMWPGIAQRPYRLWNRGVRLLARWISNWLLFVCYHVVFFAVGLAGNGLRLARPAAGESMWIKRGEDGSDPCAILTWIKQTRSWWVIGLLPFLWLISVLDVERQESFPMGIYTLF